MVCLQSPESLCQEAGPVFRCLFPDRCGVRRWGPTSCLRPAPWWVHQSSYLPHWIPVTAGASTNLCTEVASRGLPIIPKILVPGGGTGVPAPIY